MKQRLTLFADAWYWRISGVLFAAFGIGCVCYAFWVRVLGVWQGEIALYLFALWGLVCLLSGCLRLLFKRPLFYFKKKSLMCLARGCFVLFCAAIVVLQGLILGGMRQNKIGPVQAVVILGARVYGDVPSTLLDNRIEAAAQILAEQPNAAAICCGGYGGGAYSEAYVIEKGLLARGIEPGRIYREENSRNTQENLRNAAQILRDLGVDGRIAVATSDYHIWRSVRQAKLCGFEAVGVGAPILGCIRPIAHFREMLSIARDLLAALF